MSGTSVTLLQINDLHGYLSPHPELVWTAKGPSYPILGGLARIKSLFEAVRKECGGAVLALDNGDTFHGTYPAVASKGEALVPAVNALGLSAMTAHWEFAWGPEHVHKLAGMLDHPLLAANCYDETTGERPFPATKTFSVGGLRVGVIGLAATIIDKTMPPHFSKGIRFSDGPEEARTEAERLRGEGADLVVVLSHLGFPQDLELARQAPDIDVILSGHTHNRLFEPAKVGKTLIIQSGCHGAFIGRLDVKMAGARIGDYSHRLIGVDAQWPEDPEMARLVAKVEQEGAQLDQVVGQTPTALHRNTCLDAPMDDVVLAAVARAGETEIAFSNGWRYGAVVPPGPVRLADLWNMVPVDPPVSTVNISGAEILAMMEENIERTFSCDPFGQMGGYLKRFRGLSLQAKLENPKGERIVGAFDAEGPLQPEKTYKVSFITSQGVPKQMGRDRRDLDVGAIEALKQWFDAPQWSGDSVPGAGRLQVV